MQVLQVLRHHKKLMLSMLLALAGAAVLALLFIFKPWAAKAEEPVVFIRDNLLMMMQEDGQQPTELSGPMPKDEMGIGLMPWERTWFQDRLYKLNERRDKMFFVSEVTEDGEAVLSYSALSKSPTASKSSLELATGVSKVNKNFFEISTDGELAFYLKDYDNLLGGALYVHNLHKEVLVDERVIDYYYIDEPGILYYTIWGEEYQQILKMAKRGSLNKKTEIDPDIAHISDISKSGEIQYVKSTPTGSYDIYSMLPGYSPEKLISNVDHGVGDMYQGSFFYAMTEPTNLTLNDVITDDLAERDAEITEPKEEDYTTIERRSLINYWTGEPYEADVEIFDEAGFDKAERIYQEKVEREHFRSQLKARSLDSPKSLHYFSGGKSVAVTELYHSLLLVDAQRDMIIYKMADYATTPKVPLSEVGFPEEAISEYKKKLHESAEAYIFTPGKGKIKLDKDSGSLLAQASISQDGQTLYGIESGGTLVTFDLKDGLLVNRKVLDEGALEFRLMGEGIERLFYYKYSSEKFSLYEYINGAGHQISEDIDNYRKDGKYYPQQDELYYFTAYDLKKQAGTLYRYRDGKSVKISDHVHAFSLNESSGLYYIINYERSQGTGDLIHDRNGKPKQVADRIRFMFEKSEYEIF